MKLLLLALLPRWRSRVGPSEGEEEVVKKELHKDAVVPVEAGPHFTLGLHLSFQLLLS